MPADGQELGTGIFHVLPVSLSIRRSVIRSVVQSAVDLPESRTPKRPQGLPFTHAARGLCRTCAPLEHHPL